MYRYKTRRVKAAEKDLKKLWDLWETFKEQYRELDEISEELDKGTEEEVQDWISFLQTVTDKMKSMTKKYD